MRIGVIAAMNREYSLVSRMIGGESSGIVAGNEISLIKCGIGKVNAAIGAAGLIYRFHPDCLISTGVAGGLSRELSVMDVVAGVSVCYHDVWCGEGNLPGQVQGMPAAYGGDAGLLEKALAVDGGTRVHGGLICSGDRFIVDPEHMYSILKTFPDALAVDMESAAIAQACHIMGTPFLSFRIISDIVGSDGQYENYTDFWGTMAERSFEFVRTFLHSL